MTSDAARDPTTGRRLPHCAWPRLEVKARRWCIVQSEYRREGTAEEAIKGAGFLVYVPRFKTQIREARNHRRWIPAVRPLFPGYLFVDCAGEDAYGWIARQRGVRDILRDGDRPVLLADPVIDQLRTDEGVNFNQPYRKAGESKVDVKGGDEVRIIHGPFTGFYGIVDRVDAKDRITVFIELFGRVNPVSPLSVDQLERA